MIRTPREAGPLLRHLREEAGLTRAELAARAGVSIRWLAAFETGKSSVDMSLLLDCHRELGWAFDTVPDRRTEGFGA